MLEGFDSTDLIIFEEALRAAPRNVRTAMALIFAKKVLQPEERLILNRLADIAFEHGAAVDEFRDIPAPHKAHLFTRMPHGGLHFERVAAEAARRLETAGSA